MPGEEVFGYVRVSTQTQYVRGYGIDAQITGIKNYCQTHGLKLIRIFRDKGISGTTLERPALMEMLSAFNGVKKVVVLNTSRLWRDNDTVKMFIKHAFKQVGADIISVQQSNYSINSDDPSDFLTNGIMELLDQYDRMCINLRLAKGRKTKAQRGMKGCGVAPIGYTWNEKAEIVIDEKYEDIVRDIFKQYLALGSIGKVVQYLDSAHIATPRGNSFSKQAIADILSNPFYKGIVTHGNVCTTGKHQALISANQFGRVKNMLQENRKRPDKKSKNQY